MMKLTSELSAEEFLSFLSQGPLQVVLTKMEKVMRAEFDELNTRWSQLNAQVQTLISNASTDKSMLDAAQADNIAKTAQLATMQGTIDTLNAQVASLNALPAADPAEAAAVAAINASMATLTQQAATTAVATAPGA